MKKIHIFGTLLLSIGQLLNAQDNVNTIAEGSVLTINNPSGMTYNHILFQKPNFIIKRGGIVNFKNLVGKKVVIDQLIKQDSKDAIAVLKRKDGRNFFGVYPSVKAKLNKALASKELLSL